MENTWTEPQREVKLATHCRRRVKELVQRYARLSEACTEIASQGRMAPSQRVRRGAKRRDSEVG